MIGEKGFVVASIADITRAAETALGTFYIYSSSKDEVFRELVQGMGQATRSQAAERIAGAANRLEAERAGLAAYLIVVRYRLMQPHRGGGALCRSESLRRLLHGVCAGVCRAA